MDRAKKTTQVPPTRRLFAAPAWLLVILWTSVCGLAPKPWQTSFTGEGRYGDCARTRLAPVDILVMMALLPVGLIYFAVRR